MALSLTIVGSLLGVWLGAHLGARNQAKDREARQKWTLFSEAAEIIGDARVTLRAMRPSQYAAFATTDGYDIPAEIAKRKAEADLLRPRLAGLANKAPSAAVELRAVEEFLGLQPPRLYQLIELVVRHQYLEWIQLLNEFQRNQAGIEEALDRALEKLRS
jgi:hypothetical protein